MKKHTKVFCPRKIAVFCLIFCMCLCAFTDADARKVYAKEEGTAYKIMVNRAANCVTVYEKDADGAFTVPVKAFACSCGRKGHETPLGTFRTSDYYEWRQMVDGSYGQYAVRFYKGIMFHSVPYYTRNAGNMEWEQYNLLGESASLGCVRLTCADAKWIYENCGVGTEVVVYEDAEEPGPIGKPTELKLTVENPMKKWDPTDTSSLNPWNGMRPSLHLVAGDEEGILRLPVGSSQLDIYDAIDMRDALGTPYDKGEYIINIYGQYDLDQAGMYKVSVRGTGLAGMRAEKSVVLYVGSEVLGL